VHRAVRWIGQFLITNGTPSTYNNILRAGVLSQRNEHVPILFAFGLPRKYFVKKVALFRRNVRESRDQLMLHWDIAIKMIHAA
jgi:hypothetical protein